MEKSYRNGLAEVYEILKYANQESLDKIPESLKEFIKENKSDYIARINPDKDLKDQNLLYETKVILSVLYRDYWVSEDEKKQLLEGEKIELLDIENKKSKKYNNNILFKKDNNEAKENFEEVKSLVIKENLIKKILDKIKKFFIFGVK